MMTRPRRRFFRFSLRTMLVAVTVLGICIPVSLEVSKAQRQRRALARIEKVEGTVLYEHDFDKDGKWIEDPRLPGPSWLRKLLGPHYFDDVREVLILEDNFFPTTVNDDDLEAIADLRSLNTLVLSHALQVTDDGLQHIRRLTDLRQLDLSGCRKVTDKAMEHVAKLRKLEELNLFYTEIGDAGLVHLRQMTMLRSLCLSDTQVTDEGVANLQKALPKCEIVR